MRVVPERKGKWVKRNGKNKKGRGERECASPRAVSDSYEGLAASQPHSTNAATCHIKWRCRSDSSTCCWWWNGGVRGGSDALDRPSVWEREKEKKRNRSRRGYNEWGVRKVPWAQKGFVSNMVWQGHKSWAFTSGIIVPKKIYENAEAVENIGSDLYQQMIYRISV